MFETEITLSQFNRAYLDRLVSDLKDEELDWQPHSASHSVRWILAHLAIAADYGLKQLDLPFVCSAEWHTAYGPTSQPGTADEIRPSREELLQVIEKSYKTLCDAVGQATAEQLTPPHSVAILKRTPLKSKGDIIAHILATHFATHLGQLSVWRRLSGRPPIF